MNAKLRLRGVTLVELVVVTVIIAVLTAIMTTVFLRAKESAKDSKCLANLKSIGLAIHLYANDYDGFVSPYLVRKTMTVEGDKMIPANPQKWRDSYLTYTKSAEVFYCPLDDVRGRSKKYSLDWDSTYTSYQTLGFGYGQDQWGPNHTYRMNLHLVNKNTPPMVLDHLYPNMAELKPGELVSLHGKNRHAELYPDGSVRRGNATKLAYEGG